MAKSQEAEQSQDVAIRNEAMAPTSAKVEPTPALVDAAYAAIEGNLPEGVLIEVGDPELVAMAIRERIRSGQTFDEVFAPQKLPSLGALATSNPEVGETIVFNGFHFAPSKYESEDGKKSSSVYAIVQIVRRTGELELRHAGGGNVLTQLVWAWAHRAFPFKAKVISKETGQQRTTYWLEKEAA